MALKNGNSAFIDENWNAYDNQWQILKNVKRISGSFINDKIKEWGADNVLGLLADNTEIDLEKLRSDLKLIKGVGEARLNEIMAVIEIHLSK